MRRNARMSCSGSRPSWIAADADWATGEVVATDGESPSTSLIEKRGESSAKGRGIPKLRIPRGAGHPSRTRDAAEMERIVLTLTNRTPAGEQRIVSVKTIR